MSHAAKTSVIIAPDQLVAYVETRKVGDGDVILGAEIGRAISTALCNVARMAPHKTELFVSDSVVQEIVYARSMVRVTSAQIERVVQEDAEWHAAAHQSTPTQSGHLFYVPPSFHERLAALDRKRTAPQQTTTTTTAQAVHTRKTPAPAATKRPRLDDANGRVVKEGREDNDDDDDVCNGPYRNAASSPVL